MKVRDIVYVEDELIAVIKKCDEEAAQFCTELQSKAVGVAAATAIKEEALKFGASETFGVKKVPLTVPVSPNLSRGRPPKIAEPVTVSPLFFAKDVPPCLEFNNLEAIQKTRQNELEQMRLTTRAKYGDKHHFNFQVLKSGRDIEDVKKEVEEKQSKELQFCSTFTNTVPDFTKSPPKVKLNAAAIYREDALFRKQQAQDALVLMRYEEELRDPAEFLRWQKKMKEKDKQSQLDMIHQRKTDSRQSHIESHEAIIKIKEDNRIAADIQRGHTEICQVQKELNIEMELLRNQATVQTMMEIRDTRPRQAVERDSESRAEKGRVVREVSEAALAAKQSRDRIEEEIRADKIRQSRAENLVSKKAPIVFDPTAIAGAGFLDEMSYTEMKIRVENEKTKVLRSEHDRRSRIADEKDRRVKDLEERTKTLMRVRRLKSETNKAFNSARREKESKEAGISSQQRQCAAAIYDDELKARREVKKVQDAQLAMEEESTKRRLLLLEAATELLEKKREKDLLLGKGKIQESAERVAGEAAALREKAETGDRANRAAYIKQAKGLKESATMQSDLSAIDEKKKSVQRLRDDLMMKRLMMIEGKQQHEATHRTVVERNPYAATISLESITLAKTRRIDESNRASIRSHK
jgi:hypothetical protein